MARVLIADDEESMRALVSRAIAIDGHDIVTAQDGAEALEIIVREGGAFDLLLTDIIMPGMNGRELARKLLELRRGTPVLFMTGYSRNAIMHHGRLEQSVDVLQKPVSQADLAARVRAALDRRRES